MLVGVAVGLIAGVASSVLVTTPVRPDLVIALVVGVPGALGMLLMLLSGRRWVTTLAVFVLSVAPGWFGVLAAMQVVSGV
jgi:hypothetical protein